VRSSGEGVEGDCEDGEGVGVGVEEAMVVGGACWWPSRREVVCLSFCFLLCSSCRVRSLVLLSIA